MPAVKTHTDDLRTTLIDLAGEILSVEGPGALSLRRLARDASTSTMAVYTLFGDKQGLLIAMFQTGFDRLAAAMAAGPTSDDPFTSLAELGMAYRTAALANPHLYTLMFGQPVPEFAVDPATKEAAQRTYETLVDAVRLTIETGQLHGRPELIAAHLWAVSHGMVSLEVAGQLPDTGLTPEVAYQTALTYAVTPFLTPTGE